MMKTIEFQTLSSFALDPHNGWSIGTAGAIGEFMRDHDEPAEINQTANLLEITTPRGAMRLVRKDAMQALAWDSLSSDGESWGHGLAVCTAVTVTAPLTIYDLGTDKEAIKAVDRTYRLFGLGVGHGCVDMALRSDDHEMIAALERAMGCPYIDIGELKEHILRSKPHRIMLSPIGRIEIFQPVPPPDGKSPEGPHTHLLPQLVAKGRPHSSNTPIPDGYQSILSMHPRSAWRTMLGEKHDFRPEVDAAFAPVLERYSSESDTAISRDLEAWVNEGRDLNPSLWPQTRRGRTKARIVLRRLHAAGNPKAAPWRALFDRTPSENSEDLNAGENA